MQDCSNSSALAMKLLQSCTKPSKWCSLCHYCYIQNSLDKLLNKHLSYQWFETPWHSCDFTVIVAIKFRSVCMINLYDQLFHWITHLVNGWGGWGCEVSCGGHHRPRGKTTTGSALDRTVLAFPQILAYLVHNMSRSQLYLGFGHFGWLISFFGQ